jgi:hypothetical protein
MKKGVLHVCLNVAVAVVAFLLFQNGSTVHALRNTVYAFSIR